VILRGDLASSTRFDDPTHQFTGFVEDTQEYSAFLHPPAGILASRKWESGSLDHNKKCRKKAGKLFRTDAANNVAADHVGFNTRSVPARETGSGLIVFA
jgi:hypothetical protein